MRYWITALVIFACLASSAGAVQVLVNGDFEGGVTNGTPNGWTRVPASTYSYSNYTADWQVFSTGLNNYPPSDRYAGNNSLGVYRTDGIQHNTARTGLEFYEFDVLYQNIAVNPNTTYYVRAGAAAFTHHDRMGDLEDFWGSGIDLRICSGADTYASTSVLWSHGFWNNEGDSFWKYYPELKSSRGNSFTTGSTQTNITFSIVWLSKWNSDMDLCAIDNIQLDLSTTGPAPAGSESFTAKNPPTWSTPNQVWAPSDKLVHWSKAGATNGGDQFYQSRECTTNIYPVNTATGDFNGDGLMDIAAASEWGHLVSIHLQKPDGTFTPAAYLTGMINPKCIQAKQIIGSPALDLIVSSSGTKEVLIFPGNGDGTFGAASHVAVPMQTGWVGLGDFNNDSNMDLAVCGLTAGSTSYIYVYLNNGSGGFTPLIPFTGNADVSYLAIADFGSTAGGLDGKLDIAAVSWWGPVYVYAGIGNGTFSWRSQATGGSKAMTAAIANFNEDPNGIPDLCVPYAWEHKTQFLTGNNNYTFSPQISSDWLPAAQTPSGLDSLDFNKDNHPDLAVCTYVSANAAVFENLGYSGGYRFNSMGYYGVGDTNRNLISRDVNADGYDDMIISSGATQTLNIIYGGPNSVICAPNSLPSIVGNIPVIGDFVAGGSANDLAIGSDYLRVFRNDGFAKYTETYSYNLSAQTPDIAGGDFNADGKPDIAAIKGTLMSTDVYVFTNNGSGGFNVANYSISAGNNVQDLALVDIDGRNGKDIIASESKTNGEAIYSRLNSGTGDFTASGRLKSTLPANSKPRDIDIADFNSDGKPDVIVALAGQNKFALLTGKGDGYFNSPVTFNTGNEPTGICTADFNGDSKLDTAIGNKSDNTIMIFLGDGNGSFTSSCTIAVGTQPVHLYATDFNADGKIDIMAGNVGDQTVSYLRSNGDGTFKAAQNYRTSAVPGRFAAADLRDIGTPDLFVAGSQCEIFRNSVMPGGAITVTDDGAMQSETDHITGNWSAASPGRSIVRYKWAVSTTPDETGILPGGGWQYTTTTSATRSLTLTSGHTYYILAQAEDSANLWTSLAASDGILIQNATPAASPADAKKIEDGKGVVLSDAIVSRVWSGNPWVCYVQDANRCSGIRVQGTGTAPAAGDSITITGTMTTDQYERMILASIITPSGNPGEPKPLGVNSTATGGSGFEYEPGPPATGQMGISYGVNNVGLLVRVAGYVRRSEAGESFFYLDDGSNLNDNSGADGIRCIADGLTKPGAERFVVVTGVVGLTDVNGNPARCLRIQRDTDIITLK